MCMYVDLNSDTLVKLLKIYKQQFNNQIFKMGRKKRNTDLEGENSTNPGKASKSLVSNSDQQDKKQMDAFKLLMDSRNKVIGGNSPGKDRILDDHNIDDLKEKKEIKAKRILALQKMAESKGAGQNQEIEEFKEMCIKHKMEKRAERLKNMIINSSSNSNVESKFNRHQKSNQNIKDIANVLNITCNDVDHVKALHYPNPSFSSNCTFNETLSTEEEEFLKKLSPSIKKKENMLCYYDKVSKDSANTSNYSQMKNTNNNNKTIIKVKFTPKNKKKNKMNQISPESVDKHLNPKTGSNDDIFQNIVSSNYTDVKSNDDASDHDRRKRKRKKQIKEMDNNHKSSENTKNTEILEPTEARPKRNITKPIKYDDDATCISSDEELHIFTPKKKKSSETKGNCIQSSINEKNNVNMSKITKQCSGKYINKNEVKTNVTFHTIQDKKVPKLAPIFATKPQLTAEEIEAKQKFLHSGIPDHIKKSSNLQVNYTSDSNIFQTVVHIQQIIPAQVEKVCSMSFLPQLEYDFDWDVNDITPNFFKNMLVPETLANNAYLTINCNVDTLLHTMKQMYSKFPVYRTYHSLKSKNTGDFGHSDYTSLEDSIEIMNGTTNICNDNPDKLKWTDKYKATTTKLLIGNFESVQELRKWLISWTQSDIATKTDSDLSDFCHSDTDSGDAVRMKNNLLILTGKTGSGKTSSVYAVASELSIKVIEVNASSKRTGKKMLQDLQEATQSHKVDRQRDCIDNSQKTLDKVSTTIVKKRGRPKKSIEKLSQPRKLVSFMKNDSNPEQCSSQESVRTGMSLILIDDADIVFDQDDGFCSAISQLINCSKRPVIIVTESLQCPYLQKFLRYGQIIHMQPLMPRMLGTWLDIMCLADNGTCYPGLGAKLLDFFKGDIRKSINCLQYYMMSQKHINKQENGFAERNDFNDKFNINDEGSSMSWAVNEDVEDNNSTTNYSNNNIQYFMSKQLNLYYPTPNILFNVWWSMPSLLEINLYDVKVTIPEDKDTEVTKYLHLEAIAAVSDTFSFLDILEHTEAKSLPNITSKPWYSPETASLTESENFQYYDRNNELRQDISQRLMSSSIEYAQKILKCKHKTDVHFPSMDLQREKDKIVSRHKNLTGYLNQAAVLDRRAVSLDYWSYCRAICRTERKKSDLNSKRNNRYCHYLKSLNVLSKNDYFDKLADSLHTKESES